MRFLPLLFLVLMSCSDNILYTEAAPHLFVEILNHSDTILVGDTVLFQAVISPSSENVEYFWLIEPNYSSSSDLSFKKVFKESGLYNIKFFANDQFYDPYRDSLFIRVSNAPICNGFSIKIFQGSPIFEWDCVDKDGDDFFIYKFSLIDRFGFSRIDTTLTKNSLQFGKALQKNDLIHLTATNKYGIETHLDSVWSSL